jgi:hypothetical protein
VEKDIAIKDNIVQVEMHNKKTVEYSPDTVQARILKEEAIILNSSSTADYAGPIYRNISQRFLNSQNVIRGHVYSTDYFWQGTQLYTKSAVLIEKNYKGALKAGDKITVIEHGGITTLGNWVKNASVNEYKSFEKTPKNYDPYHGKSPNTLVDYGGIAGISTMRTGQGVVLFLVPDSYAFFGKNGEPGYKIKGYDGGKMVLKDGTYQSLVSPWFKDIVKVESCAESEIDNLIEQATNNKNQ